MPDSPPNPPLVSVIMVNYKVAEFALQALRSLQDAQLYKQCEFIVVDNASRDGSHETITRAFPEVRWIGLKSNVGFGKACNVAAQSASGTYLLFINPDTLVSNNTLKVCVDFMNEHPEAGVMGPKILSPNGALQQSSHRSFPTPFNTFSYLFGLSRLFPRSKLFGGYNLTYLDPDVTTQVDAVSGSFIFVRASVFRDIGGFDEAFFMYGEDLDLCARVRRRGFTVWYHPLTQIVHFKGKSSEQHKLRSRLAFYEAMVLFSRKYGAAFSAFFPRWLIYIGIMSQAALNIAGSLVSSLTACMIDMVTVNVILWAAITIRIGLSPHENPYLSGHLLVMLAMHGLMSMSFLLTYTVQGVYSVGRYSPRNALLSGILASTVFIAAIYFTQVMALSRIAFAVAAFASSFALVGWREILPRMQSGLRRFVFSTGRVMVVGDGDVARVLIRNTEADKTARIVGVVWPHAGRHPGEFEGYPVLGSINRIKHVLETQRVELLLVATTEAWYSYFIEALASLHPRHLTVKWVHHELLAQKAEQLPDVIPLQDFSV